jgi:hypothetical protein
MGLWNLILERVRRDWSGLEQARASVVGIVVMALAIGGSVAVMFCIAGAGASE